MKICPKCGHRDNPYWRHSRFDYNADYMRTDDFITQYPTMAEQLNGRQNHDPIYDQNYAYYLRGTNGIEVI